jgi:hypothetical protein
MKTEYAEIYERFCQGCPGIQFQGAWSFLHPDDDCRYVNDDTNDLIERLQQEFEADQLLASKLLVRGDGEQLCLNPRLLTGDRLFVVLRNAKRQIFDLITSTGSLSGRQSLLLLRQDSITERVIGNTQRMFLTSSMVDVLLFRSLGLAATCTADVIGSGREGLQRLLWLVGGHSDGPIQRKPCQFTWEGRIMINKTGNIGLDGHEPYEFAIVICAFSLHSFSRQIPADIASVARHLAQAETYLAIEWEQLSVWWPTVHEMSNLAYRQELQDPDLLRGYLTGEHEFFGVQHFLDPSCPPASPDTLIHALEKLDRALLDGERHSDSHHYLEKEREALADYEAQLEKTMIRPLLDSAIALSDPSIRPLRAQLAQVAKMVHMMMPRMHRVQKQLQHATAGDVFPDKSLKKIKELTELMIKLVKGEHALRK